MEDDDMAGMNEMLNYQRRIARRRMAWISFLFLLAFSTLIVAGLMLSPRPVQVAEGLEVASGAITGILTVFTTIVLGYLGVSLAEQVLKKKE